MARFNVSVTETAARDYFSVAIEAETEAEAKTIAHRLIEAGEVECHNEAIIGVRTVVFVGDAECVMDTQDDCYAEG